MQQVAHILTERQKVTYVKKKAIVFSDGTKLVA